MSGGDLFPEKHHARQQRVDRKFGVAEVGGLVQKPSLLMLKITAYGNLEVFSADPIALKNF